jgi:hypothetical protein
MSANPNLEINTDAVRTGASTVNSVAAGVSGGAAASPPTVSVPRWATSDAAGGAAAGAATDLTGLGDSLAATARQILAAVLDYEDSDARTATRLRGTR